MKPRREGIAEPEFRSRVRLAREEMERQELRGLLVTNLVNVRYLSGFTGSEASLLLTREKKLLFTDSRYVTQAKAEAWGWRIIQVTQKVKEVAGVVRELKLRRLGFEPEGMTHASFLEWRRELKGVRLVAMAEGLKRLRVIKSEAELGLMLQAAKIARQAFLQVLSEVKPGRRECDLALALETRMRKLGSGPPPFPTIVASGPRGALPHGVATSRRMKKGELVTVDFGSVFEGYQSDQTETFCLGRPSSKQRRIYDTVREAQERACAAIRPGVMAKEVDAIARNFIAEKGFGKFFGHGLGHGVGLMTHEEPALNARSKAVLQEGMVVTVEPGIYIPGFGGVRIEDMVVVTKTGGERLTKCGGPLREI